MAIKLSHGFTNREVRILRALVRKAMSDSFQRAYIAVINGQSEELSIRNQKFGHELDNLYGKLL